MLVTGLRIFFIENRALSIEFLTGKNMLMYRDMRVDLTLESAPSIFET